jgi:hypothetical protein
MAETTSENLSDAASSFSFGIGGAVIVLGGLWLWSNRSRR